MIAVASAIHALLERLGAPHFVKTSGQEGLHVLMPLGGAAHPRRSAALAEVLARVVARELPEIATIARPLAARGGKVYVDYLQNGRGKLIAAPFSVRPRPRAPVSTPLAWSEVTARLDPARHTIKTVPDRFAKRADPLRDVLATQVDIAAVIAALQEQLHG